MTEQTRHPSPRARLRQWAGDNLSIRQRLALWYATLLGLTLLLFSLVIYAITQTQLESSVREDIRLRAHAIASALQSEQYTSPGQNPLPTPAATLTPTPNPGSPVPGTPAPAATPNASATETLPTPAATVDPQANQAIQTQLRLTVPQVITRLDLGIEVLNTQLQPKYRAPMQNGIDLPLNREAITRALAGTEGYYTASANNSLLAVYVVPIVVTPNPTVNTPSTPPAPQVIGLVLAARPLDDVSRALSTLKQLLFFGDLVAVLFTGLGGWFIAESGLRPISSVTRTARAIAINAHAAGLGTRVHYGGPRDEVGELVTTVNDMLEAIERVTSAQRRFVADASHELRAPLTTIKGSLEFLRKATDLPEEERTAMLEDAYAEAERMAALVSDLLLLARVDAAGNEYGLREAWLDEQLRGRREPLELDQLAMDIFRHGRSQLRARNKDLHLTVTNLEPMRVLGDPGQLRQLVLILLDNAIKYTPAGGKIRISVTRNGDRAALSIADTGIGIEPEVRPHIFERFYRADRARERDEHGSGLGLAIARWIAEAHRGEISVHSQPGQGSTFTLLLPALRPSPDRISAKQPALRSRRKRTHAPLGMGAMGPLARLAKSVSRPRPAEPPAPPVEQPTDAPVEPAVPQRGASAPKGRKVQSAKPSHPPRARSE